MKKINYPHIPEFRITRVSEVSAINEGSRLETSHQVCQYWRSHVEKSSSYQADKEILVAVLLNTKLYPLGFHIVSVGTLNEALAHPREIFRPAVLAASYGFVLAHNHPSGDPSPSQADHKMTHQISQAAGILQIRLLDHIIVGNGEAFFSFRDAGFLLGH